MMVFPDFPEDIRFPRIVPSSRPHVARQREFFVVKLKDPRVDRITRRQCREFIGWREGSKVSARTVQKDVVTLGSIFANAIGGKLRTATPRTS
jgi:hypothetical protein